MWARTRTYSKSLPNPLYAWVHPPERQRSLERTRIARHVPICGIIVLEIKDLTVTLTHTHTRTHTHTLFITMMYSQSKIIIHAYQSGP